MIRLYRLRRLRLKGIVWDVGGRHVGVVFAVARFGGKVAQDLCLSLMLRLIRL